MMAKHSKLQAALAGGFLILLVLAGCGKDEDTARRSASGEAQATGTPPAGDEHAHHHGSGQAPAAAPPGHDHGHGAGTPSAAMDHAGHEPAGRERASGHAGHAGMAHGTHAPGQAWGRPAGRAGHDHSGMSHGQETAAATGQHAAHGGMSQGTPPATGQPVAGAFGAAMPAGASGAAPAPVPSGQPARTLYSDILDAPAATSVGDAQRSAEIAREMSGGEGRAGHGSHGGTYVHVDAGRPRGRQGPQPQPPGADAADPHQHGESHGAVHEAAAVYACPMHPEVTSPTPGTCPQCGMDLERREEERREDP
jgi:hypothetical protein